MKNYKSKAPKVYKNYNIKKTRGMTELRPLANKELAIYISKVKGFNPSKHQATKRGYKHTQGEQFLPVKPSLSPAEYRRQHKGKRTK